MDYSLYLNVVEAMYISVQSNLDMSKSRKQVWSYNSGREGKAETQSKWFMALIDGKPSLSVVGKLVGQEIGVWRVIKHALYRFKAKLCDLNLGPEDALEV